MCAVACVPLLAVLVSGCGGTTAKGERQDKDEPSGEFPVAVEEADVPARAEARRELDDARRRAQRGRRTDPQHRRDRAVRRTKDGQNGSFDRQIAGQEKADKNRPELRRRPDPRAPSAPRRARSSTRSSARRRTSTRTRSGRSAANRTATFEWKVTAVRAGDFRVCYRVAAGLDGKAKAVPARAACRSSRSGRATSRTSRRSTGVADDGTVTTLPEETRSGEVVRLALVAGTGETGTRGYLGNRSGSSFARPHIENSDPRVLRISF